MNPTDPSAYQWPPITAATLLAGLKATTAADDADGLARLLARWAS